MLFSLNILGVGFVRFGRDDGDVKGEAVFVQTVLFLQKRTAGLRTDAAVHIVDRNDSFI